VQQSNSKIGGDKWSGISKQCELSGLASSTTNGNFSKLAYVTTPLQQIIIWAMLIKGYEARLSDLELVSFQQLFLHLQEFINLESESNK